MAKTPCSQCRGPGFNIPGQGTGSHMLQPMMLCVAAKTWCSQINNLKKKRKVNPADESRSSG